MKNGQYPTMDDNGNKVWKDMPPGGFKFFDLLNYTNWLIKEGKLLAPPDAEDLVEQYLTKDE